ncbi:hypothetical protein DVA86_23565 [Streptomyces armeniacus]|uniref:WW domain-containing protein n=1 Tax=Streptomyces armeniacus TaxID=83291 RepID=A0A345XU59_9ACTN|nr:endo-alpha-N-acetylgalactosaminidase family protein [Streptomyces armeniacus]AXK35175.1 hypothetical protein DVA86_23565 [Streptomyces armeniacus]
MPEQAQPEDPARAARPEHPEHPDHPAHPEPPHPARRTVVVAGAVAGLGTAAGWYGGTAAAVARTPAAARAGEAVLRSAALEVRVDTGFPRIIDYRERATGAVLYGQPEPVRTLLVDGTEHAPRVTAGAPADDRIGYVLALPGGAEAEVEIRVEDWRVHWRVTRLTDTPSLRVGTLEVPGLALLSVRGDQPGASLLAARVELDKDGDGDTLVRLAESAESAESADGPEADPEPVGCAYAAVWTGELAASVETNTSHDRPDEDAAWENGRLRHQTLAPTGSESATARLTCGQWTHRAATAPAGDTEPLPYATVVLTRDRNGDGTADWQDAAIALREVMVNPLGADEQHLRVVPHIPFNFASQATNPFLATLDEVKRISLATAGLRQFTLLKGYQSEGHDSAHPDYAGNYNRRAGGLDGLNTLLRAGRRWHSDFAVHVNATESYPVANAFSETLVDKTDEQWDWLDQSYRIDQRRDLVSGDVVARFRALRRDTDPALNTLYLDVFRESGWTSDRLQRELRAQGWRITTEWGHGLERSALWSHWATETDYGADTSRGINSRFIRFLRNHQKDVFADKWPTLLGIPRTGNYEGWRGKIDWSAFYRLIWTDSLPAKYLQAYAIRTWTAHEITFEGPTGTSVTDAGGTRRITTDGRLVYDGGTYLLPWPPRRATDPERLYHYSPDGGRTTWRLPRGWTRQDADPAADADAAADGGTVTAYRLTAQGRTDPVRLRADADGRLTLDAEAGQPYVLYRGTAAPPQPEPGWGEGTPLVNPGFHAGGLDGWTADGPARVEPGATGDHELVLAPGAAATVSQRLSRLRLRPGAYAASVQVQIGDAAGERRRAALTVRTGDGVTASRHADSSTAVNYVAADRKHGTRFQRLFTPFTVPEGGGPVTLELSAEAGGVPVRFDAVRIVPDTPRDRPGWGPFVKGDAGGATDPRTHIAQRHGRYTQRGWNGKAIDDVIDGYESLKSRGENKGLVYRTVPHTARFTPGRRHRVEFRYENEKAGQYAWVTAVDEPGPRELSRTPLPVATEPAVHRYEFTAPEDGDCWVGLRKTGDDGKAEFVLDGFTVTVLP